MNEDVDEVKAKTDIVSLIGSFIEVKKAGRNYKALCPFHSEKTPSFVISPELQIFKCFGCSESGDAISFMQKLEGMEFGEALKFLAQKAGVKLKPFKGRSFSEKEKLYEINNLAARFYNYLLLNHPVGKTALEYLIKERGLKTSSIKAFMLGLAPDNPFALQKFLVNKKKFLLADLEKAGLVIKVEERFIDRFKGRVIFPLFDHRGNCVGLAGRIMPKDEKTQRAKYINSPETLVYHKGSLLYGLHLTRSDIKHEGFAVVVEGEFDTILPWQAGIKNTVAIKGSALTPEHVKILSRITGFLVLALDTDLAGDIAARRGINIAQDAGLDIKVATLTGFKDPAEASKSDPSVFKKSISQAQDIWDYLIDSVISRYDKNSGEGKAKISREIVPILSSINDKIVESHYLKKLAQKLGVREEAVYEEAEKFSRKQKPETLEVFTQKKESKGRRQILEEKFLELAFQGNLSILENKKYLSKIKTPLALRILKEYEVYKQTNKTFDSSLFAQNLPKELLEGFVEMILKGSQEDLDHPERIQKEIKLVHKELSLLDVKEKLEKLKNLISELEKSEKSHELVKAQEEFAKLSRKRSSLEEG